MGKVFNAAADCKPQLHYMVDISGRIEEINGRLNVIYDLLFKYKVESVAELTGRVNTVRQPHCAL